MAGNRELASRAFAAWADGTGSVATLFAEDMRWEIVGRSAASRMYESKREFVDEVLAPFDARFDPQTPFRPVTIRGIYADNDEDTVIVVWDGEGTTVAGTVYRNTYAWIMTFRDGQVIRATAFFDSIAFNELWQIHPAD